MQTHVDRDAGFAAFRQGRSLCVRLDGTLDAPMARGIARQVKHDRVSVRLRLECSTLRQVQPDASRILAHALLAWTQAGDGRSVEVLNLDYTLHQALAWHPLRFLADPDELVFLDPDHDEPWSRNARPSRH